MFVEKLQTYYNQSSAYIKHLIDWCCINNQECSINNYVILSIKFENYLRPLFRINYLGNRGKEHNLKEITDDDIDFIKTKIEELDGTLLVDVVSNFMENYKIFKM